jgi:hypothetical protein
MYLVCNVLDFSLPSKHDHTTDIARVTSLIPKDNSNFTNQTSSMGFVRQSASCFHLLMCSIPMLTQKCSTSMCFDLLWYSRFLVSLSALSLSMYSIFFLIQSQTTVLTAGASTRLTFYILHLLQWSGFSCQEGCCLLYSTCPKHCTVSKIARTFVKHLKLN